MGRSIGKREGDVIIDQDLRSEVITAINVLLHQRRLQKHASAITPSAPIITIHENMGMRLAPGGPAPTEAADHQLEASKM